MCHESISDHTISLELNIHDWRKNIQFFPVLNEDNLWYFDMEPNKRNRYGMFSNLEREYPETKTTIPSSSTDLAPQDETLVLIKKCEMQKRRKRTHVFEILDII